MPSEVTVVVPTHNRRRRLELLLRSLESQSVASDRFDVVVAVDGATDGTEEMLNGLRTGYALTVVALSQGGAARARNEGARRATAPYVLFLDDDMAPDPDLIAEHLRAQSGGSDIVGLGRSDILPRDDAGRWFRWRQDRRNEYFDTLREKTPTFMNCWGGNLCLPRELFLAVGGFAESVPGHDFPRGFPMHDSELGFRLAEHGARFVFVDTARSVEDNRETLRGVLHDQEVRGRSELLLYELHPATLPHLEIGGKPELDRREIGLRRVLLALRVPPAFLAPLAALVPGADRAARFYRVLYSYARWRGVKRAADRDTWRRLRRGPTILMYHAIGAKGESPSVFLVPERRFRRQMRWLARGGYTVIALEDLVRDLREHRLPPAKSVVLTFDDGYRDNALLAAPVLERLGYRWTLFLPSDAGPRNAWDRAGYLKGRELLDPREAGSLPGCTVGAHSRTHADLVAVSPAEAGSEIVDSKRELEEALGKPVPIFAYPFGRNDEDVRGLVREAGFEGACGVVPGPIRPSTDPYLLHRFTVDGRYSLARFALMLSLGDVRLRRGR